MSHRVGAHQRDEETEVKHDNQDLPNGYLEVNQSDYNIEITNVSESKRKYYWKKSLIFY